MGLRYQRYWLYYVGALKGIFDLPYCQNKHYLCLKYRLNIKSTRFVYTRASLLALFILSISFCLWITTSPIPISLLHKIHSSILIHKQWLKSLILSELGPQALRGLPVEFLLLQYSVLLTAGSLSLLQLHFLSWFISSRRSCIDK